MIKNSGDAHNMMMRMACTQLKQLVNTFRDGFPGWIPDAESMERIELEAGQLWERMNEANLIRDPRFGPDTKLTQARNDAEFQGFMKKLMS